MFAIYSGQPISGVTRHIRFHPCERKFEYPLALFKFDTSTPPMGYDRRDHYGSSAIPLDTQVRMTALEKLGFWPAGAIECYCNLRAFGVYAFNPITPYFIHSEQGEVIALICEVHNTPWAERCIYAMLVQEPDTSSSRSGRKGEQEFSTLTPTYHKKIMHVSPYHPAPNQSGEPVWYYKFLLRGKEKLTVEVYRKSVGNLGDVDDINIDVNVEDDDLRFTAVLDVTGFKPHNDSLGSIRTIWWVYYQALLLLSTSHRMYFYTPPGVSLFESKVFSWLLFLLPCRSYFWKETPIAISLLLLSLSMSTLRYSHSSLFPLWWIAFFAKIFIYCDVVYLTFQQDTISFRSVVPILLPFTFYALYNYPLYRNALLSYLLFLACPPHCSHGESDDHHIDL